MKLFLGSLGTFSAIGQGSPSTMAAASALTSNFIHLASFTTFTNKALSRSHLLHKNELLRSITSSKSAAKCLPRALSVASAATAAAAAAPPPPPHFSDLPLDRAAHLRKNPSALEELLNDSRARTIAFYDRKALVSPLLENTSLMEVAAAAAVTPTADGDTSGDITTHAALPSTFALLSDGTHAEAPDGGSPAWIPLTWHPRNLDLVESVDQNIGFIFLGLVPFSGAPVFACRLLKLTPKLEHLLENTTISATSPNTAVAAAAAAALVDVRSQGQKMIGQDAAIYALASGLLSWHSNTQFCSKTGTKTDPDSAGHARRPQLNKINKNSAASATADGLNSTTSISAKQRRPRAVYPRVDPAVIVAVTYGDWLLLGRKKTWDSGRYSLLAGFSEIGETLEDAVVREVSEESGVLVDKSTIQYHSSQPWPFPQSLMIGFLGEARHIDCTKNWNVTSGFEILPRGSSARTAALDVGMKAEEVETYAVPAVHVDQNEIEDARWFHRDWLLEKLNLKNGDDNVLNISNKKEERTNGSVSTRQQQPELRIPGKYALANRLITDWLLGAASPRMNTGNGDNSGGAAGKEKDSISSSWSGHALPDVQIDQGVFKYVLLRVSAPTGFPSKLLVRGDCRAAYHNHIVTACKAEAAVIDPQLSVQVLGGGRIEHYSQGNIKEKIDTNEEVDEGRGDERQWSGFSGVASVYGYSAAFGPAPHEITAAVLKKWDPFMDVSVSYEGY